MEELFFDYHTIIVWNSDPELIKIIEATFNDNFVYKHEFTVSREERIDKVKKVYFPFPIQEDDPRCNWNTTITLYVLRFVPQYKWYFRSEGYRLCNTRILDFKLENRKVYPFAVFHCSDNVEEANLCLDIFNLPELKSNYKLVNVDDLYHIIHFGDKLVDTYNTKNFKICPIKNSPVVKYLMGYKEEYLKLDRLFCPRPDTLDYLSSIDFNQSHELSNIKVVKYNDKYVVCDGMHRSAVHYFNGEKQIFVKITPLPQLTDMFYNFLTEDMFSPGEPTHLDNFNKILFEMNNRNIRFVILRGFAKLPKTADTDLDIVIHPDDYIHFQCLMNEHLVKKTVNLVVDKDYKGNLYRSYATTGAFGDHLTNHCYFLDSYSNLFFFENESEPHVLDRKFLDYLFNSREKQRHYYIPNIYSEFILTLCRALIDKKNTWSHKHLSKLKRCVENPAFNIVEFYRIYNTIFLTDEFLQKFKPNMESILFSIIKTL